MRKAIDDITAGEKTAKANKKADRGKMSSGSPDWGPVVFDFVWLVWRTA